MVSIHAPARGATCRFNPYRSAIFVSIHAPARGATLLRDLKAILRERFNPRAREGRDARLALSSACACVFQSTRPRGARRGLTVANYAYVEFQSTRPRGARPPAEP